MRPTTSPHPLQLLQTPGQQQSSIQPCSAPAHDQQAADQALNLMVLLQSRDTPSILRLRREALPSWQVSQGVFHLYAATGPWAVQRLQVPARRLRPRCSESCLLGHVGLNLREMNSGNTLCTRWLCHGIPSLPLPWGWLSSHAPRDSSIPLSPTTSECPGATH